MLERRKSFPLHKRDESNLKSLRSEGEHVSIFMIGKDLKYVEYTSKKYSSAWPYRYERTEKVRHVAMGWKIVRGGGTRSQTSWPPSSVLLSVAC